MTGKRMICLFDVDGTLTKARQVSKLGLFSVLISPGTLPRPAGAHPCFLEVYLPFLTQSQFQTIDPSFHDFLQRLRREKVPIALVGGSDIGKIMEQMGSTLQRRKSCLALDCAPV